MAAKPQAHGVRDLVISCLDYRFRSTVARWIRTELGDQADLVAMAGASKAVLDEASRACLLQQIDIAVSLHGVTHIHILDHIDCGAYGGSKMHKNKKAETDFHIEQCQQAAALITARFPELAVFSHLVSFDGVR